MITRKRLKSILKYDPKTGLFTRKIFTSPNAKKGQIAGCLNCIGYWQININGMFYYAHRLAWSYMTGKWPKEDIDHKNRDRSDNRWKNLREATRAQNNTNTTIIRNPTGFRGVTFHKQTKRWSTKISVNKKQVYLGTFKSGKAASDAYQKVLKSVHGEFAKLP